MVSYDGFATIRDAADRASARPENSGVSLGDRADRTKARILVIDDDASVCDSMVDALAGEGYECMGAENGSLGLARVADTRPHLIILDILLPKLSGFELVATLRSDPATRLIPVVIVTALADRPSYRRMMELGAEDYLTKPFTIDELLGAVETQLRKQAWRDVGRLRGREGKVLAFAGWRFDVARRRLFTASGGDCRLTISEACLLRALLDNPKRVLVRHEIMEHLARSLSSPSDRSVDVLVARLRRKIEADPKRPKIIETVRGVGYVLNARVKSVGSGTRGKK